MKQSHRNAARLANSVDKSQGKPPKVSKYQAKYLENPHLDPNYKARLQAHFQGEGE